MAGWLIAWTRGGRALDRARWARAAAVATRFGGTIEADDRRSWGAIAAWRRDGGEFPRSGTLTRVSDAGRESVAAFVGQVVGDAGDDSEHAIATVAPREVGDSALAALNGPFASAVLWDAGVNGRGVRIVLDRHRHYPVFVHHDAEGSVASTDLGCVAAWIGRPEIDRAALDMLVRVGELIDRMTMVRGVEILPPAMVLEDNGSGASERRYWHMRHRGEHGASVESVAGQLGELMQESVRRIERANHRIGITLSGGLDSRFLLGLCERRREIPAFTWGLPGCRDIVCAAAFAKRIGAPHTIRNWEPGVFPGLWSTGADLTAGNFGVESMHMAPYIGLLSKSADVILNGLAGDALLGGNFLKVSWLRETDAGALASSSWRWRVSESLDRWGDRIMGRPGREESRTRWVESILGHDSTPGRPVERLNDWLYPNRVFRYTNSGTFLLRWGVESHAPFFDRDFIDALMRVPFEMKLKHRLYLRVLELMCPDAAATRWQRTMIPPSWGFWANTSSMAMQRMVRAGAKKFGINAFPHEAVADPSGWLRTIWAADVERILLDGRLASRGLVEIDAVREAWESHKNGENLTRPIAALIAVELWMRRWIDGEHPAREIPA